MLTPNKFMKAARAKRPVWQSGLLSLVLGLNACSSTGAKRVIGDGVCERHHIPMEYEEVPVLHGVPGIIWVEYEEAKVKTSEAVVSE
jgi:hypothetical protein